MRRKQIYRKNGFSQKFRLVAGVSLSSGVLWLSSCDAPSTENSATNATGNSAVSVNSLAETPSSTAKAAPHRGVGYVLFMPNNDGMLSRQIVHDTSTLVPLTYEQKSQRALELLWPKLKFFPPGTRLLAAPKKEKNGIVRLNFNKGFLQLDTAPENAVLLILDSISQSLGALESPNSRPSKPARIMIVVEGRKITEFNQFSLAEPWEATIMEEKVAPQEKDELDTDAKSADNKVTNNKVTNNKVTNNKVTNNKVTDNKISDNQVGGGY